MESSVRARRVLEDLGVLSAFAKGDRYLLVGPVYALRRDPDTRVRMLFARGDDKEICVGYASSTGNAWAEAESEPYTMRSFGYYQRRLKRIGDWVETPPPEARLEL